MWKAVLLNLGEALGERLASHAGRSVMHRELEAARRGVELCRTWH